MKSLKMMILVFLLLAVCLSASADTVPLDYADPGSWVSLPQEAVFSVDTFFVLPTVNMKALKPGTKISKMKPPRQDFSRRWR